MGHEKMSEKPLKILFTAMDSIGHLNACLGLGSLLVKRGHEVYFAYYDEFADRIKSNGLKFISLSDQSRPFPQLKDKVNIFRAKLSQGMKFSPLEMFKEDVAVNRIHYGFLELLSISETETATMLTIIDSLKPDVCLMDHLWSQPWMYKVPMPVIPLMSTAPNALYDGPPYTCGCSIHDSRETWDEVKKLREQSMAHVTQRAKEMFEKFGVEYKPREYAEQLGIYIYPGPLDFKELGPPRKNWVRLDTAVRIPEVSDFVIPEKIASGPGKLIYFSMGTLASMVPEVMEMLLGPLSRTNHRYIVSTGPNGDLIKLHDNMWGDKYLNQIAILPCVDLFITHGGSNSLVEGLSAGKPLIVIPQFGDQLDNGQRIADLGLGIKINLWEFSGEKLVQAIETILNSPEIHQKVAQVSQELKNSDSADKVCSLIEQLARTRKSPL